MRTPRLFTATPLAAGATVALDETARRHAAQVLRLAAGDAVVMFDGSGGEYEATIELASKRELRVSIGEHRPVDRESPLRIELGQSVAKGERMDLVMQKSTELGVTRIAPLMTERTVVKLDAARAERRHAHWHAIAVHASQQCGRTRVPEVAPPAPLDGWLDSRDPDSLRLVLSGQAETSLDALEAPSTGLTLLVGPEGGLTGAEVARARERGFVPVRFGPRRLRTETAAIAAITILQSRWGDLR